MKLTTQTVAGFVVGVVVGITAVLIISPKLVNPPRPTFYSSIRVDGNLLMNTYNDQDFAKVRFYYKIIPGTTHTDLLPAVYNSGGTSTSVRPGLVRVLSTGATLSVSGDSFETYLEHNRLSNHYLQLQTLVSLITNNPGGYFILNPAVYDAAHIHYLITAFKSDSSPIDVSAINRSALQLDPSPPARPY